jgi:glycosyltransferase involved in cell wall biosynthesis
MAYRAQDLAAELHIPVVASFHTHFVSYFRYYGVSRLERVGWSLLRRFYRRCARVYAPSRSIIAELAAHGIERLGLWSRGIDPDSFSPSHRDESLVQEMRGERQLPVLLLVSRLVKEKDLGDLINVDAILRSRAVAFKLVLVGDGPMRHELEKGLPEAFFAGHLAGHELARWYASADVFVFPSTTETLGNVVLEALASGLPSVVVDQGGPQDLISPGGNGFVARANDPVDIADRLQLLLEDRALRARMSRSARDSALSRDWEIINERLIRSYTEEIEGFRVQHGVQG